MSRSIACAIAALTLALVGCDAAKEPMSKAREAEAAGKIPEAKALYAEVCKAAESSPFCPVAKQRIEALTVREATNLVAEGQYAKAKELSATVADAPAKRAFEALAKTRAMSSAAAFEEANASADKAAARAKMEELAGQSSPVADKAKEWLTKNGPALLLDEVKAACKPDGTGSCVDLGKKIAKLFPTSPEAGEAKTLVDAEYKRVHPLLKQAEALLVQRLEISNWKNKYDICLKQAEPSPGGYEMQVCKTEVGIPEDRGDPFSTSFLEGAWKKKLGEIHDPGWVKSLEERWGKIESDGIYDPASLPKPGEQESKK
ncbi:hypothetical protein [Polyangium sp. y55x31]|uniref:hypothetical protein n=1 Tax=Polyangium sp. y55x31 TaxID=3042688 RepID=UPI0024829C9E|nr:hypothetical protein [Polyangium sp. y55x31]MDI1484291.1 hypothetical protein [Polyangium sp. y55x31]